MRFAKQFENEQGMALVTTLMFLVILFFLGVAAYMTTSSDLRISGYYRQSQDAFYVAESGIQEANSRLSDIYKEEILDASEDEDWRYYIGDSSTLAAELGYGTGDTLEDSLSGMNFAVQLRLKTAADPNSWGIGSTSQILYWNGTAETPTPSKGAYPIFIATSLGAKGDARKKIIAEIRGNSTFIKADAALYVNGNLTKNGVAGSAVGSYNTSADCPAVADVITTPAADAPNEATDWPAGTSTPPVLYNNGDVYPIATVMETIRSNYDQLVTSGNNQTFGTSVDDMGVFYCDGDFAGNGLNGYGILAVNGDFG